MSNAAVKLPGMMTVADFLDWPGDGTVTRYELVDGVLRAQDPASDTHNTILTNLAGQVWLHLRGHRPECRAVTTPGIQPRVRANWNYRVPDLVVTCTPNRAGVHLTPDPLLLIEILSPGNAADTYENVRAFSTLPTVRQIVVVHSTQMLAEVLNRAADGAWPADAEVIAAGGTLQVASIGMALPLTEIYAATHLAPEHRAPE